MARGAWGGVVSDVVSRQQPLMVCCGACQSVDGRFAPYYISKSEQRLAGDLGGSQDIYREGFKVMGRNKLDISAFLEANGIKDPTEFLSALDDKANIRPATQRVTESRGVDHLSPKRGVSREEVNRRFAALRHV